MIQRALLLIPIVKDGYLLDISTKTQERLNLHVVVEELRSMQKDGGRGRAGGDHLPDKWLRRWRNFELVLLSWFVYRSEREEDPHLLKQLLELLRWQRRAHQHDRSQEASMRSISSQKTTEETNYSTAHLRSRERRIPPAWYCQIESDIYFVPENFKRFAKLRAYDGYSDNPLYIGHVWTTVSERSFGQQKMGFSTEVTQGLCLNRKALGVASEFYKHFFEGRVETYKKLASELQDHYVLHDILRSDHDIVERDFYGGDNKVFKIVGKFLKIFFGKKNFFQQEVV